LATLLKILSSTLTNAEPMEEQFWDDPYDPYRVTETRIPMKFNGTKVGFTTRVPADNELADFV
jgi:hypothetical protein